ncbi:MAG: PadR family transcriptional regulator [Candidatus Thorarchaeota archaeon]|nr:MAG: hypothetical protein DRP09_06915 [Candidatus Thorarchaeota archaeon]
MAMPQSIPRGLLRHVIPRLLRLKDMTGTEIMQTLHEFSEGEWNPSPGTIYPLLSSLEDDGIIETVKVEGRSKTYRLTKMGRKRIGVRFHRKSIVGHRMRLGPKIWERLLDQADRTQFHIRGMVYSLEVLESLVNDLGARDRSRLLKGLKGIEQHMSSLIDRLESGGT